MTGLWVLSQDGDFLAALTTFRKTGKDIIGATDNNARTIGTYTTEERAKEVFEEIRMAVSGKVRAWGQSRFIDSPDRFIFKMPKE